MATATAVDQSKLCKVINNSGNDISIALPLTSEESHSANSIVAYTQDLEVLPVAKGGNIIKDSDSDTVTLDRTDLNTSGKTVESYNYNLLVSTATWLTPLASIGVTQDFDDDGNYFYDDQTVSSTSKTAMTQTVDFYQKISAYPDSKLAKDYIAAMNSTSDSASSKADGSAGSAAAVGGAITGGVAAFFAGNDSFKQVSLAELVAVENYYDRFPFVWAQYADSASYYLYTSDGSKTSFQGILFMKKGTIDITKANGGYDCSFVPAVTPTDTTKTDVDQSNAKPLTYTNGVFGDDPDTPQIALKGSFQLKRTFTKDPNDTKIIVVISGTINGATAVGFDSSQATKPDDTTQDWLNALFHPKTAAEIFNSVMQILGALMMLHFIVSTLWGIGKWIKQQASAKEPVSKADLDAQKAKTESSLKSQKDSAYEKVSGNKSQLPEDSQSALDSASTTKAALSDEVSSAQMQDSLLKMNKNIKDIEPFASQDGDLQSRCDTAGGDIREAYSKLSGEVADLKATLAELRPQMDALTKEMASLTSDTNTEVAQKQGADITESVDKMETIQSETENENKTNEDETADGNETDPDADTIEFPDL